jgi:hypothetical protein
VSLKLLRLKLRCQEGFTTVTLIGVLMVGGLMVSAGYAAVDPDIGLSKKDADYKQSYAAAEAGLNWYLYHMGQDNNYYLKCDQVPVPDPSKPSELAPVSQQVTGTSDPRTGHVELLPAKGYSQCTPNQQESMIDPTAGTFRVRATGRVPDARGSDDRRSIIATLRRKSFIDFLYFTDRETADPATYSTPGTINDPGTQAWASKYCAFYRAQRSSGCTNIQFANGDAVNGPFHTNDDIYTCDTPIFGRTKNDAIELAGASPGYTKVCSSASPNFKGTRVWPGGNLGMPPSNKELALIADPAYRFSGYTKITLAGANMTVTNAAFGTKTMALPANGVIWVGSSACASNTYARKQDYTASSTCGTAEVKGNFSSDITIGAESDILITDDITRNSSNLLAGLIAQNFVRVYHRVKNRNSSNTDCDNDDNKSGVPANPGDITIQAAILALQHSFIVDNWYCGVPTGQLNIDGAIAQEYRGPVGTGGSGGINSGYMKNYNYNDRLRFREPPQFVDPVQSSWRVVRQNEQIPAK